MSWQWPAGPPGHTVTGTSCYPHQRHSVSQCCHSLWGGHTHRYTHTQLRTDWGDELLVPDSDWNQLKVATTSGPQQTWVKIVTTCGSSSEEQRFVSTAISIFPDSNPLAVIPSFHSLSYFISLERSGEEDGLWMEQISRFLPPVVHYFANTFQTQLLSWR